MIILKDFLDTIGVGVTLYIEKIGSDFLIKVQARNYYVNTEKVLKQLSDKDINPEVAQIVYIGVNGNNVLSIILDY